MRRFTNNEEFNSLDSFNQSLPLDDCSLHTNINVLILKRNRDIFLY